MIQMKIDDSQLKKRVKELEKRLKEYGTARCEILPSHVIYMLCEKRGEKLLKVMPRSASKAVEKRYIPKVEAAVKKGISGPKSHEALARAYRYGAYAHIERLWQEVKRGAWGQVDPTTIPVKASAISSDMAANKAAREAAKAARGAQPKKPRTTPTKPRSAGKKATRSRGNAVTAWGVRSQGRDRRWYDIQKGKQKHGRRSEGKFTESGPLISVWIGRKKISDV